MAEPGLTEIATTTLRNRRGEFTNNVENNNPVSRAMKEKETFEMEEGGRTLISEVTYAENGTFTRYSDYQPISLVRAPVLTAFENDWKQFAGSIQISGREKRMNAGTLGKIKLLKGRIVNLEYTLENYFNADLISDGTADGGLQMGGLKYWISTTPTVGTVGGIDRSVTANAWARNFKFDTTNDTTGGAPGAGATTAANVKTYLNWAINSVTRGTDGVDVLLAGQKFFEAAQGAMQAIQRITSDSPKKAKAGYREIEYEGIPMAMCGGLTFGSQTQILTTSCYGVNCRHTKVRIHQDAYMEPLPQVQSINQDAEAKIVVFMGNVTNDLPATNFVIFD